MTIQVEGPDGTIAEFPDGTPRAVIERALQKHYGLAPNQKAARASATSWAAAAKSGNQTARPKRSAYQRQLDVFWDTVNTSWIAEGYRQGFKEGASADVNGAETRKNQPLLESPAVLIGQLAGAASGLTDVLTGDAKAERAKATADRMIAQEKARRGAFQEVSKQDPFWEADNQTAAGAAALTGALLGAATDPASYLSAGRTVLTRALTQAGAAGAADAQAQLSGMEVGLQEDFSVSRTALSAAAGGTFSAVGDGAQAATRWAQNLLDRRPASKVRATLAAADELHAPALSEAELPQMETAKPSVEPASAPAARPKTLEGNTEAPLSGATDERQAKADVAAGSPVEGAAAPVTPAAPTPPAGDGWGKIRSPQRAAAAQRHLTKLQKIIKPDEVEAFVAKLNEPPEAVTEGIYINPKGIDWGHFDQNPGELMAWADARAEIFADVYDKAGAKGRSWAQTQATSRLFGSNLSDAIKAHADITGEGGISARYAALREMALESDQALMETIAKARREIDEGVFSGATELAQAIERTVLMDAMAAGAQTEIARSLNYMKSLSRPRMIKDDLLGDLSQSLGNGGPLDPAGVKAALDKLDDAYKKGGSPALRDTVRKMRQMGVADYLGYLATGNLLSAPKTHLRNLVGTPLHATFMITERYVAAGIGAARQAVSLGSKERVTFAEAMAYSTSMAEAFQDALSVAGQAFVKGGTVTDGGSSILPDAFPGAPVPYALSADRIASWKQKGLRLSVVADVAGTALFELVRTFGYRPSVAADEFFKVLARRMQLNSLAYREAHYRARMVEPSAQEEVFEETLRAIRQEPTAAAFKAAQRYFSGSDEDASGVFDPGSKAEEMALILRSIDARQMALDHAKLMTFQKTGPVVEAFDKALRMVPLVKYLYVNFLRTPMALLKAGMVDRNPAVAFLAKDNRDNFGALAKSITDSEAALARGGAEADLMLARLVVGSSVMATAWGLWASGNLVGRRGQAGSTERQDGIPPYSVRLPSGEWFQFSPASPIAEPLGLVADVAQALKERDIEDGHAEALMGALLAALGNNVTNKTFLAGFSDLTELLNGPGYAAGDAARGRQVAGDLAKTVVPRALPLGSFLRSLAQDQDPVVRDARSFLELTQASIPLLSETLPAKRDFLGRPLVRPEGQRGPFQAFNIASPTEDPLEKELARLAVASPEFRISMPPRRYNEERLSRDEYWKVVETQGQLVRHPVTGRNMEESLRDLVASEDYGSWTDAMREYRVKKLISTFRTLGSRQVRRADSPVFMGDMVRRTGAARLKREVGKKGLDETRALLRGQSYGLQPGDPELEELRQALFPQE